MHHFYSRKIAWGFVGVLFLLTTACEPANDTTNSIEENPASQSIDATKTPHPEQEELGIVIPQVDALIEQGIAFAEQGNYDLAIQAFDEALTINPDSLEAYIQRGQTYLFLDRQFEARADVEKAIEVDRNYPESYSLRASIYYSEGSLQFALDDLNRYIELKNGQVSEETLEFKAHIEGLIGD